MPDLMRHPEPTEITGFRPGRHPGPDPGRNDVLKESQTFCEIVNLTMRLLVLPQNLS